MKQHTLCLLFLGSLGDWTPEPELQGQSKGAQGRREVRHRGLWRPAQADTEQDLGGFVAPASPPHHLHLSPNPLPGAWKPSCIQ